MDCMIIVTSYSQENLSMFHLTILTIVTN